LMNEIEPAYFLMPSLVPVALTMTVIWKTKEVILASVFAGTLRR
jgi:hypothetical protein